MTRNSNTNALSVLPFYGRLDAQNHRKDYAFGNVFQLITPKKLIPFQIVRDTRMATFDTVKLMDIDGALVADLKNPMLADSLRINRYESEGYDVISYSAFADLPILASVPSGLYYLEISDGVQTWFSEILSMCAHLENYVCIEFWDNESLDLDGYLVEYASGFKYRIYLDTQVGRPEYSFEEQIEVRDGFSFYEKQIGEKTFKFQFLAPEYVLDALRVVWVSDNVIISSKGETWRADSFLFNPRWLEDGFLAEVEAEFQTDTIIKKTAKGFGISLGDFNNDFNNDFKNQ